MVDATEIGDFAWRFEELLNKLIDGNVSFSEPLGEAVRLAAGALDGLRARLTGEATVLSGEHVKSLSDFARKLAGGGQPDLAALHDSLPDFDKEAAKAAATPAPKDEVEIRQILRGGDIDPTLKQLMDGEIRGHLSELESFVSSLTAGKSQSATTSLVRSVHTLAGTLSMAPIGQEPEVARELELYLET